MSARDVPIRGGSDMSENIKELVKEARGWHAGHSNDSQRMVWLINKLSDAIEAQAAELHAASDGEAT